MPKLNKKDNLRSGQVRTVPKNNNNINNKSKCQLKSLQKDDKNLTQTTITTGCKIRMKKQFSGWWACVKRINLRWLFVCLKSTEGARGTGRFVVQRIISSKPRFFGARFNTSLTKFFIISGGTSIKKAPKRNWQLKRWQFRHLRIFR